MQGVAREAAEEVALVAGAARVARCAGLGDREALLDALVALTGPPEAVAELLRRHHLVRLVHALLPDATLRARLPAERVDALASRRPIQRLPAEALLAAFDEVRAAFAAAGLPLLLLKGLAFAERLYGGLDRRPQHDIDVLVRRRDRRRARRLLGELGFSDHAYDLHSRTVVRDGVAIDVHHALRRAPAFAIDEAELWRTAVEQAVGPRRIRTLSDEYALVLLVLAAFEDLGQGMAKLKQLLDLYLLARAVDAALDWERFLARRERENLLAVSTTVLALVLALFEADGELPRLATALEHRRGRCALAGRDEALALVAAPRKDVASLAWFGRVYPGSLWLHLLWFWAGGFPANLRSLGPAWLGSMRRLAALQAGSAGR
jgi:hypothetical protein